MTPDFLTMLTADAPRGFSRGELRGEAQRRRRDIFIENPFPMKFQPRQAAASPANHLRMRVSHEPKRPHLTELENLFYFVLQIFRADGASGNNLNAALWRPSRQMSKPFHAR
jgi:hypothetical protein